MVFGVVAGVAERRREAVFSELTSGPPLVPQATEPADDGLTWQNDRWPEFACVQTLLSRSVLDAAGRRAERIGVTADRVLIAGGLIPEETYLRALGDSLGIGFERFDCVARTDCPVDDERLLEAAAAGLVPLVTGDNVTLVVAPRGVAARRLATMIRANPEWASRFRLTTTERLNRFAQRYANEALAARAADQLREQWPALSAAPSRRRTFNLPSVAAAISTTTCAILAPVASAQTVSVMLAALFFAWQALRVAGAFVKPQSSDRTPAFTDDALPVYTVIAALYREAASVDGLLTAIEQLNYPPEKLDVILAIEADDRETRAAIAARTTRIPVSVLTVPAHGPRTKPKALNAALPFARGAFTVIYDAEDRPEPDQLREAVQAFCTGDDSLACVQAPLCIDNTADSWLARLFTAEYAGQFDVFLPGLAAMHLPLPLGGSSNHFNTATLRAVNAWDPYNVTEDADLGMRLARFGYRAGTITSTTYEEAPARTAAWLRQRTRWFKGWMQTWLVHMRAPRKLLHDLGLPGFLAFQLIVGGNVLSALVHPFFFVGLIHAILAGTLPTFVGASAVAGYFVSGFLGWLGLMRRGLLATAWVLMLTPLHWLLLSLAAWRALYQLVAAPYTWEKTEHGLAKSSRRAHDMTHSLLALERYLTELQENGELPIVGNETPTTPDRTIANGTQNRSAKNISADRRRLPQAYA